MAEDKTKKPGKAAEGAKTDSKKTDTKSADAKKAEPKKADAKKPKAEAKVAVALEVVPKDYVPRLRKHYDEVVRPALIAKFAPELKDALTAEQFKRLKEIHVQAMRDQAYTDADVVKALALKKEQTDKIAEINKDFATKSREAFQPGGGGGERPDFNALRTKAEEMGKARDGKLSDVLTKDQQAKLKELKGKEFDVAQLQQRGFGGPPGGGGAGGGRPGAGGRPAGGRPAADAPKADAPKAE